jgi:dTDP-4-amino-4,6-dideoxygalactose transaminase
MKVPLLDLKAQYQSLKSELDTALLNTAESQYFILGPEVQKLEKEVSEYLGANNSVGVSSGTDALLLALMALDIKAGDEVIVPTYSFFATAGVVSRLNAIPVFVDCDPVTFNIDPTQIEAKITEKTKAIIPVHLYGQSADMDSIMKIAKKHNLKVIEDGAQAISVQYKDGKCVGTIGDVGCYSFFPSKNLGCFGDGGMTVTMDAEIAELLKVKRVHGGKPKYFHSMIGGNFRLDAIQAGVLSVKLPHLDSWSQMRRDNAALYTKLFTEAGLAQEEGRITLDENNKVLLPKAVYKDSGHQNYHIYNQYVIRVDKRDELLAHLRENEIGCEIYYPLSFHQQECFQDLPSSKDKYPNADFAAAHSIALPIYPELTEEQIAYVVNEINEFLNN